jgi:hypothetical protein
MANLVTVTTTANIRQYTFLFQQEEQSKKSVPTMSLPAHSWTMVPSCAGAEITKVNSVEVRLQHQDRIHPVMLAFCHKGDMLSMLVLVLNTFAPYLTTTMLSVGDQTTA